MAIRKLPIGIQDFPRICQELNGTAEEALAQIETKGYGIPYEADGRTVVKVGVEFDKATRNLGRWLVA